MTADIATTLASWSSTAASNQPDNSDAVGPNILAENLRTIQAVVRDAVAGSGTIASATTTDLSTVNDNYIAVTGTTTITGLGTVSDGIIKVLKFAGVLTFTHNGTSLILPGAANITTAANDIAVMRSEGSGNWRCLNYFRASALPALSGANSDITSLNAPALGAATATTQPGTDNSTKVATTAQVVSAMQASPGVVVTGSSVGLGYGVGAGGTVTQATSKSTAVTLNKLSGQITMNNAALAASAVIAFQVNNNLIGAADSVVLNHVGGGAQVNYNIWPYSQAGAFFVALKNISAGSLSDAVVVDFKVIKGATS